MRRLCFAGSFARARVGQLKASSLVWCWWGWSTPSCPQDRGGLAGWAPGQSRGTPPVRGGSAVRPGPESRHAPGQRRVGWVPRARVAAGPRSETGRAGASCQSRGMPPVRGGSDGCSGPESRHALGQRWGRPCAPGQSRGTPPVGDWSGRFGARALNWGKKKKPPKKLPWWVVQDSQAEGAPEARSAEDSCDQWRAKPGAIKIRAGSARAQIGK